MTAIVEKNEFLISILPLLHIGFHPQSRAVGLVEHVQHTAQINGPALKKHLISKQRSWETGHKEI